MSTYFLQCFCSSTLLYWPFEFPMVLIFTEAVLLYAFFSESSCKHKTVHTLCFFPVWITKMSSVQIKVLQGRTNKCENDWIQRPFPCVIALVVDIHTQKSTFARQFPLTSSQWPAPRDYSVQQKTTQLTHCALGRFAFFGPANVSCYGLIIEWGTCEAPAKGSEDNVLAF